MNLAWLLAPALAGAMTFSSRAATPPSFVVLVGEGQGWSSLSVPMDDSNLRSASADVRTPHLDRLAREGMRFSRFLAASPRCTPSRAALLTGRSPAQLRMTFVREGRADDLGAATRLVPASSTNELPLESTTVAELLRPLGYATAHFGKWHLGRTDPSRHGFDASSGPTSNGGPDNSEHPNPTQAFACADAAVAFIRSNVAKCRPFYVQVCQYAGKSVLDARAETYAAAEQRLGPRGRMRAGAVAVAEDADAAQGRILQALDHLGVATNTFVFYTTDHGAPGRNPPLSGGKGTLGDGGLRVPLLVRGPGIPPGRTSPTLATMVDLLPTVADLAHADVSGIRGLEGGSLVPAFRDPEHGIVRRPRESFVVHFPHYDKDPIGPASALYQGDFKLVRRHEDGALQLFNLARDPSETRDLAHDQRALAAELDQRLAAYLKDVGAAMPAIRDVSGPVTPAQDLPGERRGKRARPARP